MIAKPEITLTAWARLEGVVRHGTQPVPAAKLDVYPLDSYDPRWAFLNFQVQTEASAEGKFVFAKLKPGRWRVRELPAVPARVVGPLQHEKDVELQTRADAQHHARRRGPAGHRPDPVAGRATAGGRPVATRRRLDAEEARSPRLPRQPETKDRTPFARG